MSESLIEEGRRFLRTLRRTRIPPGWRAWQIWPADGVVEPDTSYLLSAGYGEQVYMGADPHPDGLPIYVYLGDTKAMEAWKPGDNTLRMIWEQQCSSVDEAIEAVEHVMLSGAEGWRPTRCNIDDVSREHQLQGLRGTQSWCITKNGWYESRVIPDQRGIYFEAYDTWSRLALRLSVDDQPGVVGQAFSFPKSAANTTQQLPKDRLLKVESVCRAETAHELLEDVECFMFSSNFWKSHNWKPGKGPKLR